MPDEVPAELVLEGIPDESELPMVQLPALGPDDPTMDLGEISGDFFDAQTEEYIPDDEDFVWGQERRRKTIMWWGVLFVLGTGLGVAGFDALNQQDVVKTKTVKIEPTPKASAEAPAAEAPAAEAPAAEAPAAEAPAAEAPAAEAPATEPAIEVIQDPIDKPKNDKPSGRAENAKGWKAADAKKWSAAKTHFQAAASNKGGDEARFGLAYVTEHQGNKARATGMYCKLSKTARGEFKREAEGRLKKLRHTCP
jgi:pyruvate/2-oxoglutarate dehydrogenase complex dihydrolipoamide acyltransferase (E2) component